MLRPYQTELSRKTRSALSKSKEVLMVLPTGMGKTVIAKDFCERAANRNIISVFLSDRKEILEQTSNTFTKHNISHQIIDADTKVIYKSMCYLGMVETFFRRASAGWFKDINIGLIICDEAHVGNFKKALDLFDCYKIGLTATPVSSSVPLKEIYKDIVLGPSVSWGIENGFLVPSKDIGQREILDLKKQNGEFTSRSQRDAFKFCKMDQIMFKLWSQHALTRKTVCFNIDIEHNNEMMELFELHGIKCGAVDSKMNREKRDEEFRRYRDNEIQVLLNVGIATKGFDDPKTSCIIVNRATDSVQLWYQMIGRGGRICEGKDDFVVIDMGNNILRHGSYNEGVDWEYLFRNDEKKVSPKKNVKLCPLCYAYIYNMYITNCPVCNTIITPKTLISLESQMPAELIGKEVSKMTLSELNMYAKFKGYKRGWAWVTFANRRK
jgi:superfamily II DNA or RNA helicase